MAIESSDRIEAHFPTIVMQRDHAGAAELNVALARAIRDLDRLHRLTQDNAVRSGKVATEGGYQTSLKMNLFQSDAAPIRQFLDSVLMPAVRRYLQEVFMDEAAKLTPWPVGWATVLNEGDWQRPHFHPTEKNVASGVYYVQLPQDLPDPQGCIDFINPVPISVHHGYPSTRRLHPTEGRLLLFPPYYMHYVLPFKVPGERIVIAFDVLAQKPGLKFVF